MPSTTDGRAPAASPAADTVPVVVLDTNVVLDWLVFQDRTCVVLAACLDSRRWAWHASEAMRAELAHVLSRGQWRDRFPHCEHALAVLDRLAQISAPAPAGAPPGMRCRDPDDQKFLDLACSLRARWLFSRDRALLDLARHAQAFGVEILSPAQWLCRHGQPVPQTPAPKVWP